MDNRGCDGTGVPRRKLVLSGRAVSIGLTVLVAGLGLVWATKEEKATQPQPQPPATEPEAKKELEPVG